MERGEFDDLPGAGRPLDLGDDDPNWWARRKIQELRREGALDDLAAELERQIDGLWLLPDEQTVRQQVGTLNDRINAVRDQLGDKFRVPTLQERDALQTWRTMHRIRSDRPR